VSLKDAGFRLIERRGEFRWLSPAMMEAGDVDCTDMSDDEFEEFVSLVSNRVCELADRDEGSRPSAL
jgi:hypothetical protein